MYLPNNYQKIDLIIGIQDLVIGAPYDGEDHSGAIYIYLGTPDGISQTHSQVLYVTLVFSYQNCSDLLWEKNVLVIKKKGWEFVKILRSLEQFIQTVRGEINFW